jgi:hypothetical protein
MELARSNELFQKNVLEERDSMDIKKCTAIVTGGASDPGKATARAVV